MRLQTIPNRLEKFKSFAYGEAHFEKQAGGPALIVQVLPRKNSRPYCSGCLRRGRPYDHLKERRFEFVPLWGILVFLAYRMRRVDCPRCGVTVEMVPWGDGKRQESADDDLSLVSGELGQAPELGRGRSDLPDVLG